MNSKERVQAAMARRPVDKVPLGFYLVDYDIIERVIGRPTFVRNRFATVKACWEGRRDEVVESIKKDTVEFYRKIDCADIIVPKEAPMVPPKGYHPEPLKKIDDEKYEDKEGRIFQAQEHANEWMCIHDPTLRDDYTLEEFEKPPQTVAPDPSEYEAIDYVIDQLGEERYVAAKCPIVALTRLGGTENGLVMHALQPEVVIAANRHFTDQQNALDPHNIRPNVPGVFVEQDMAGTNGPLVSPDMFRELCFPFLKERIQHIKESVPQVSFHNCGNNIPLMEMFIDCGIDCYQSLQTTAGMEVGKLKERFGDRMAFWGGVSLEALILGEPDQIRQEVRTALERGAPGGGFILGPSHSIAKNTKYDNFMAMLDEFDKLRDKY